MDQRTYFFHSSQTKRPRKRLRKRGRKFNDRMVISGSDVVFPAAPLFMPTIQSIGSEMIQRSTFDPYDIKIIKSDGSSSSNWAAAEPQPPAKMKIIRKATTTGGGGEHPESGAAARKPRRRAQAHQQDESQQQQQQLGVGVIRVCSDCSTTKTPLWRSGPCGPKSLCNACGIRQRKARRAAAAAAASNGGTAGVAASGGVAAAQAKPAAKKEKRMTADVDRSSSLPFKKRCKMVAVDHAAAAAPNKATPADAAGSAKDQEYHHVPVDNVVAAAASLHQSKGAPAPAIPPPFHALPADEITDAAMLLMTLSCGLVRSY